MFTASCSIFHPSCFRYCHSGLPQLWSWILRSVWIVSLPPFSLCPSPFPFFAVLCNQLGKKINICEDGICSSLHQKPKSEVVQRNGKAQVGMAVFPEGRHTTIGSTSPCVGGLQSSSPLRRYLQSHRVFSWAGEELGTNPNDLQRWSRMEMLITVSSRKVQKGTNLLTICCPPKRNLEA